MSQLAIAMSKVASTANTMGVDVDQLNAQIATVVATTRQAPESVGTAFKTIYTRMNDIKTGSDEAEISLGRYSGKMAELGFNVLDATGHLRDTGQVMEEIGGRWQDLTREQQVYLAQTMGGQRQVNQLMALFDNWTTYSELLNTSLESEGTLAEKNARYMESLGAKMEQLGAAGERVKASLITADMINPILTGLTGATNLLGLFIESIGGGTSALLGLASGMMAAFGPAISREINNVLVNIQNTRDNLVKMNEDVSRTQEMIQLSNDLRNNEGLKTNGQVNQTAISNIVDEVTKRKQDIQQYYGIMQAGEVNAYNAIVKRIGEEQTQAEIYKIRIKNAEDLAQGIEDLKNKQDASTQSGKKMLDELSPDRIQGTLGSLADELKILSEQTGVTGKEIAEKWNSLFTIDEYKGILELIPGIDQIQQKIREASGNISKDLREEIKTAAEQAAKAIADLDGATLNGLKDKLKDIESELQKSQTEADNFVKKMQDLSAARTLVQLAQGTTQLMSGMSSLGGVIDNVFNKKMSAVEKFTKTIMGLGYAIPSVISGFNKLQTTLVPVAAHFSNQTQILEKYNKLQQVNNKIKAAQKVINTGVATSEMTVAQAESVAAVAKTESAAAQQALNAAMLANPVTWIVAGIVALTAALTIIPKIYDAITMSADQAKQAVQNFNNAQKESTQKYAQAQEDIKTLSEAEDEWNRLSKAAGDYNSTIDNLTEEEKERYYELSNLIASYNSAAVIGYDAHGNAIINKNTNLKEQIQLINQAAQAERRRFYNSDEYRDNVKGQKVLENEAKDNYQASNQALSLQRIGYANTLRSSITAVASELAKDGNDQARVDEYNKFLEASEEEIIENEDRILQMLVEDENTLKEKYGNQVNFNIVAETKQAGQDYKSKVAEVESDKKQMQKASQLNYATLFDQLSLNSDAYNQLKELGITNVEGLITSYVEGAGQAFSRANLGSDTYKTAAEKINNDLLQSFVDSITQQQNGKQISIGELFGQFAISDQEINGKDDWTYRNLQEKSKVVSTQINKFLEEQSQETIDAIKSASGDANMEKVWEEYFANLLNVDKVKINFNTGKIEKVTSEALERLNNKIKENIKTPYSLGDVDIVSQYLKPDLTESQLDFINKRFTELNDGTRTWKEALQQAQNQMVQLSSAANGLTAIGLLNKRDSGEKLSDEENQKLKSSLEEIQKLYPGLIDQIKILNTEWLKGTEAYKQALLELTEVSLGVYQNQVDKGIISQAEATAQIYSTINSIDLLEEAYRKHLLTNDAYKNKLAELASQYDSCKDELNEYISAIRTGNLEEQTKATQALLLATRSAENAAKYGLEAEQIDSVAESYREMAKAGEQVYAGLNNETATDAATRYLRLNNAIETLQKSYTDVLAVMQTLKEEGGLNEVLGDKDSAKTLETMRTAMADILDVEEDYIDNNFVKDHLDELKGVIDGDIDSLNALHEAFTEEQFLKIDVDDQEFQDKVGMSIAEAEDRLNNIEPGKLEADDLQFLESLANVLYQSGWTIEQINNLFKGADLNVPLNVDAAPAIESMNQVIEGGEQMKNSVQNSALGMAFNASSETQTDSTTDWSEAPGYDVEEHSVSGSVYLPTLNYQMVPGPFPFPAISQGPPIQETITYPEMKASPQNVENPVKKDNSTTAMRITIPEGNKSAGGKISHKNSTGGNKKSSGGKGGKGGKGGGGGKAKEPNKAKGATNKADRYRNNTVKANKLANQMTKLQKQQERLTGKDSLKNLQKQLQILKKQNDTIRERIGLQRDEQKQLANNLKKSGATFDKDGTLNNYFKVHANIMKKYNDAVAKWNKMSADQQQKNKEYLNNAKTQMDNALKDLERYDKLQQEIAKSIQQQIDNAQEQIDLKAKQFELKIKAELDLSEAKRDWNKFRRDLIDEVRDDDILGLNKYRFADISSYFNNIGTGSIQYLIDRLKELTGTPDGSGIFSADYLNETLKNMTVTDRQARLEQIKKVMDDLQGQMEDFKSLTDDIKKSIFDTIDAAQDAFDQQMDEYEYVGDLINHNMKVTELLFGDQAYDRMTKYYDRIEENNNNQLDFLTKEKDLWYSRMMEEQARMAQLNPNTNAYKQAEDRFKQYQKHWMDSVNDLNGKIEDALDNIIDKYANAISNIFLNFDLSLGGGKALNDISDEWDMLNDLADTYLDKINSAYEIEKLQNAFDDAIDDNEDNIAAQQSLNNLMEQQLAYLKDKEKLTQYDVDRANTLLQIEMKRLALEQSRNNKNRLRLRRDSQGNYTYQYTADTEAMNKAEQELADARNSLYNSDKAAYVDNLSAIQKSANDIKDKLEDIWKDENLSKEQKLQKSYELQKYYGQKINDLIAENASIRNNLMESGFEELAKSYGINEDQFMAMSKEQQDTIFKDLIPQANSYAAQMVENIAGAGGMATFFQNLLGPLVQSYDNRVASISAIEEKSKTNFENIVNDTDILIGQAEQLLDNNDKLVGSQEEQLNLLQSQLNVVSQMLQKYEAYKSAISDAVKSGYNELNDANASIVGTTRTREDAATAAQMKQLENGMNAASSAWDIKNYTPYTPQWSGSDFAALFGSANIIPLTQQNGKVIQELGDVVPTLSNLNISTLFGTIDNNIFNSINNILNNILETSKEYYATSLAKQDAIRQAVVANQTIHIDADFPNAKDVRNIIEAIEGLANAAAQRANTKGI